MYKIFKFIADVTQGECFTSFKYYDDNVVSPAIEYEDIGDITDHNSKSYKLKKNRYFIEIKLVDIF